MFVKTVLAALIAGMSMGAAAQTNDSKANSAKVTDLGWIAGCWERNDPSRKTRIVEQWMSPDGDAMLGMSRTVKDGRMSGYEFLRIVVQDGSVNYVSRPHQNTSDTAFRLIESTPTSAIFSNPDHDFPQRIIYRRDGDKLIARIEGTMNGKTRGVDFPYTRAKCD